MGYSKSLLISLLLSGSSVLAATNPFCKGGVPAIAAAGLASYPPATSYCSSAFPLPTITSTVTASPTTVTTTVSTQTVVSTVLTTTTTTSFTISVIQKRTPATTTTAGNALQSLFNSVLALPSSSIAAICTCLETPRTTFVTTTPTVTASATSTTITTTTVTSTSTVTATAPYRGPICNAPNLNTLGAGGCSSNCYCDPRVPGGQQYGVCDTAASCTGTSCTSDTGCPSGFACATFPGCGGKAYCFSYKGCSSSFSPNSKRSLFGFSGWQWPAHVGRMQARDRTAAAERLQ